MKKIEQIFQICQERRLQTLVVRCSALALCSIFHALVIFTAMNLPAYGLSAFMEVCILVPALILVTFLTQGIGNVVYQRSRNVSRGRRLIAIFSAMLIFYLAQVTYCFWYKTVDSMGLIVQTSVIVSTVLLHLVLMQSNK